MKKQTLKHKFISTLVTGLALALLLGSLTTPALAQEESPVSISSAALVEVKEASPEGRLEVKRVPADKILPGEIVIFVNTIANSGEVAAADILLNNPVPEHMVYIEDSAIGEQAAITFSVDGGQSYDSPEKLIITEADGTKRSATVQDYTHIQWQLEQPLEPGTTREVEFRAKGK